LDTAAALHRGDCTFALRRASAAPRKRLWHQIGFTGAFRDSAAEQMVPLINGAGAEPLRKAVLRHTRLLLASYVESSPITKVGLTLINIIVTSAPEAHFSGRRATQENFIRQHENGCPLSVTLISWLQWATPGYHAGFQHARPAVSPTVMPGHKLRQDQR
jgi:hypothetical protein